MTYLVALFLWTTGFDTLPSIGYAVNTAEVRTTVATDSPILGSLQPCEEVVALGQDSNGTCLISYHGQIGYTQGINVVDYNTIMAILAGRAGVQKPLLLINQLAHTVYIGDSRTTQMYEAVENAEKGTWIAEAGKTYAWLPQIGIPLMDAVCKAGDKVVIQMGMNDLVKSDATTVAKQYLAYYQAMAPQWASRQIRVSILSMNPVQCVYGNISNEQIDILNGIIRGQLPSTMEFIDTNTYLKQIGYQTTDGIHYSTDTYRHIYEYISIAK